VTAADCLACALLRYLCFMVRSNGGTEALAFVHAGQRSGPIRTIAIQCEDASRWQGAVISRVVCCTAEIDAATNPSGYNDQDIYLRALPAASGVDPVAYGSYVAREVRPAGGQGGEPIRRAATRPLSGR
jgi:hypothetical protein